VYSAAAPEGEFGHVERARLVPLPLDGFQHALTLLERAVTRS
jgi:hypothetical protein